MPPGDLQRPAPADAWLGELARRLPRHHELLGRLIDGVKRDPRVVQLSVGCSIGRGTADELSDLDCELSLEPDAWPSSLELVDPLVRSAGDAVDVLHHQWAGSGEGQHRRTAVLYENGIQLDLMVWPVSVWSGMHPPNTVVLHATREVFTRAWDPTRAAATVEHLHEWSFLGWWALQDADKYLRRGSPWEARQQLEEARNAVWRLAAAAQKLPFPEYGITSLLDAPEPRLPAEAVATATDLDLARLRVAVERCAELLDVQWAPAVEAVSGVTAPASSPLARWARDRLGLSRPPNAISEQPEQGRPSVATVAVSSRRPETIPAPHVTDKVRAALFSGAGSPPLGPLVQAARALIRPESALTVAYLPAASTTHYFVELTASAFEGVATVETVGVDSGWGPNERDVERVRSASLIYISGGNTYLLAERLRSSGLWESVLEQVLIGVPLLAFSAGSVLCGPTILSSNDWNVVESTRFDGLAIVPFHVNVHYPVDGPTQMEREERLHHFLAVRRQPVVALEEEAWLAVDGPSVVPRGGRAWLFTSDTEMRRELPTGEAISL